MQQTPYRLDEVRRDLVLGTLHEVCQHRDWSLLAAHVRTNHVHAVLSADRDPEHVMNTFKSWASRFEQSKLRYSRSTALG
ncbi:MAG: transposase [Acidobacteriota bacterium]|nr:transposase [Acidobacteriota bacterium]